MFKPSDYDIFPFLPYEGPCLTSSCSFLSWFSFLSLPAYFGAKASSASIYFFMRSIISSMSSDGSVWREIVHFEFLVPLMSVAIAVSKFTYVISNMASLKCLIYSLKLSPSSCLTFISWTDCWPSSLSL